MAQINGGIVRFEKNVKTGDYESEKAIAELSFTVEENEDADAVFDRAAELAQNKVLSMLGKKVAAKAAPAADTPAKPAGKVPAKGKNKADLEAEAKKPAEVAPPAPPAEPEAAPEEDWGGGAEAAPPMSDKELVEAISAHNAKIKSPAKIKELIAKFAGNPPKGAKDIPAEQRAKFVAELHELKPLA